MTNLEAQEGIPPSAGLVLSILSDLKISDLKRLRQETGLSRRGLMYALKMLNQAGLIETRVCLTDTRRRYYCIKLK